MEDYDVAECTESLNWLREQGQLAMEQKAKAASRTNLKIAEQCYRRAGAVGLTDDEALAHNYLHQNSWRPSRRQLMKEGKVIKTNETRLTRAGLPAFVYVIVD